MLSLQQWLAKEMDVSETEAESFLQELIKTKTHIDHKATIGTCNLCSLEDILIEYSIFDEELNN